MANVLFLVHRMPYPPNKGDKLRSYHMLKEMSQRHRVFLGTLVDDPADMAHLPALKALCVDVCAQPLHPLRARVASLVALLTGEPLTMRYFRNTKLAQWVRRTVEAQAIDVVVVFSSSMAPYAMAHPKLPVVVDFIDIDSAKWAAYAGRHRGLLAWLYGREGRTLLTAERTIAQMASRSFFSTENEAALFRSLAPSSAARVEAMDNGVDAHYYSPQPDRASPFEPGEKALVFTGAMDYWPNVDAVCWFVAEVLPRLLKQRPELRLHIVGRSPTSEVRALAGQAVLVTGTVPDVRPYLQHAAVVVAPLRLARGIQNKILEAMAMGRPVVAAQACVDVLDAEPGAEIMAAETADDYLRCVLGLLATPDRAELIGRAGQHRVQQRYTWAAHLARLDRHLVMRHPPPSLQADAGTQISGTPIA